jgi:hypothetical protein
MKYVFFSNKYLLALLIAATVSLLHAQPKIQIVEGTNLDFGKVFQGSLLKHDVTIKNVGTDTLVINNVIASCGCTATIVDKKVLPPNETSKVTITFNPKNFHNEVTKRVTVKSNDPLSPEVNVQFKVKIVDILSINPNYIWYSNVRLDTTYLRTVSLVNSSDKPLTILSVKDPAQQIQTSLKRKKLAPGEKVELTTTFHPKQRGTIQGAIEIMTDHPQAPKVEVRYFGNIKEE